MTSSDDTNSNDTKENEGLKRPVIAGVSSAGFSSPLSAAIDSLFLATEKDTILVDKNNKFKRLPAQKRREVELAVTVLLVDLASSDQDFEIAEYNAILVGLKKLFGTTSEQVKSLINQATLILKNLRGTSKFTEQIKTTLSTQERQKVMQIVDEVISADGFEDGYETYLRQRIGENLGIELKPLNIPKREAD